MQKMLGIAALSLALTVIGASSASATPHIDETNAIKEQPDAPKASDKCGPESLEPVLPKAEGKPWVYESRQNVVTVKPIDPNVKFAGYIQTEWIVPVVYTPCEEVDESPVFDPSYMIVTPIEAPCVRPDGIAELPATTDRYTYGYTATSVLATEAPGYLFQQDIVREWPLAEIVTPCPVETQPEVVVPAPVSALADTTPDAAPVLEAAPAAPAVQPETQSVATKPQVANSVESEVAPAGVPLANVGSVDASVQLPTQLANTGVSEDDRQRLLALAGIALMLMAGGKLLQLWMRGYFARG